MHHRNIIFVLLLSLPLVCLHGQSVPGSNIVSRSLLGNGLSIEERAYDNGLGDIVQEVVSYQDSSVVVHHEYDLSRRRTRSWLPVTVASGSGFVSGNIVSYLASSQYSDTSPFSRTDYDAFLQSQPSSQYKAGSQWHDSGKKVSSGYSEYVGIGLHSSCDGYVSVSHSVKYLCTSTVDEDGCPRSEYTDLTGRLLISETSQGRTYYVYNEMGDISHVLPPALTASIESYIGSTSIPDTGDQLQKYAYIYRYDQQRHCIYKKLPGCEPIYYVYDRSGACILTQDGNQRQRGEWSYSIPDRFGRPCLSGICHISIDYEAEPLHSACVYAEYDGNSQHPGGYMVKNLNWTSQTLYTATYYDSYDFIEDHIAPSSLSASTVSGFPIDSSLKRGLQTGSATACIGASGVTGYTYSAIYYDSRYNVAQVKSTNHRNGTDITSTTYTYTGKPQAMKVQHIRNAASTLTEECTYTYDAADRLVNVSHKTGNGNSVTLQQSTYNTLGQLMAVTKPISGTHTTTYSYDIHSWMSGIDAGNLFQETLLYANSDYYPCYNGNISRMEWKSADTNLLRGYRFRYDNASRLVNASYTEGGSAMSSKYNTSYAYDCMGNITSIGRKGLLDGNIWGDMDDLTLSYDGNQLVAVSDAGSDPTYSNAWNFFDASDSQIEYEYDENGNMTKDLNKKISSIQYNSLNLPAKITLMDGRTIKYTYGADGKKLRAVYSNLQNIYQPIDSGVPGPMTSAIAEPVGQPSETNAGGIGQELPVLTSTAIDYCGNITYKDGRIEQMLVDGGYVTFTNNNVNSPTYHFYIQDHLGNNRVVVKQDGTVEQVNHYYPYGGLMAENTGHNVQRYKYNGKELDRMHGLDWYDYGARHYDAAIGRWPTMDPLCEKFYDVSPYAYCGDNPIIFIDFEGYEKYKYLLRNKDNEIALKQAAAYKEAPNSIHIWAHGDANYINYFENKKPWNASNLLSDLKQKSELLNNHLKNGEQISIVLHSCETGKNIENGFAKQLSKLLPNATIYAPSDKITLKLIDDKNVVSFVNDEGTWNVFKNGQIKKKYKSRYQPEKSKDDSGSEDKDSEDKNAIISIINWLLHLIGQ